jgi:predicted ATP-dependent endonuclease of OLD family
MILTKVRVKNFLSVNGQLEFPVDPQVTVLLGANDHGKSNLLRALTYLNKDNSITVADENWDSKGAKIDFEFKLTESERKEFNDLLARKMQDLADLGKELDEFIPLTTGEEESEDEDSATILIPSARLAAKGPAKKPASKPRTGEDVEGDLSDIQNEISYLELVLGSTPDNIVTISRDGVGAHRSFAGVEFAAIPDDIVDLLIAMIPRVELFESSSTQLPDSVKASEIMDDAFEFLQGIFFYAGLNPTECESLFIQDDETDKQLEIASAALDKELRQLWAQGVDLNLHFQLKHRGESIELLADDPSVKARKARMSKRSAGVTQFFRLSMVLHARRRKNPANSYIYIFDEPGVFLHPKGQKDLLQVFERLSVDTQIIYATHSLFMLNQNFPERHRLITKDDSGTKVDSKPYRANWKHAVDALGIRLTANILFSPTVLLVEGDSDPLYIYELFRELNHRGAIDADANLLGILSYSDLQNLRFLMQTFKLADDNCQVMVLCDGDSQGKDYAKAVGPLAKKLGIKVHSLDGGLAIEDYVIHPDLLVSAAEQTIRTAMEAIPKAVPVDLGKTVRDDWQKFQNAPKDPKQQPNAGKWFKEMCIEVMEEEASKVALARNYAFLCRERSKDTTPEPKRLALAISLCHQVISTLKVPSVKAPRQLVEAQ